MVYVYLVAAAIIAFIYYRNQKVVKNTNDWIEAQEKLLNDHDLPFHRLNEDIIIKLEPQAIDTLEAHIPPGYGVLTMTSHGNFLYIVLRKDINQKKTTH